MEAIAKLNNVPTSPRKMRLIADLIRGMGVDLALNTLKFDSKVGSKRLEKLLLSAISKLDITFILAFNRGAILLLGFSFSLRIPSILNLIAKFSS